MDKQATAEEMEAREKARPRDDGKAAVTGSDGIGTISLEWNESRQDCANPYRQIHWNDAILMCGRTKWQWNTALNVLAQHQNTSVVDVDCATAAMEFMKSWGYPPAALANSPPQVMGNNHPINVPGVVIRFDLFSLLSEEARANFAKDADLETAYHGTAVTNAMPIIREGFKFGPYTNDPQGKLRVYYERYERIYCAMSYIPYVPIINELDPSPPNHLWGALFEVVVNRRATKTILHRQSCKGCQVSLT